MGYQGEVRPVRIEESTLNRRWLEKVIENGFNMQVDLVGFSRCNYLESLEVISFDATIGFRFTFPTPLADSDYVGGVLGWVNYFEEEGCEVCDYFIDRFNQVAGVAWRVKNG